MFWGLPSVERYFLVSLQSESPWERQRITLLWVKLSLSVTARGTVISSLGILCFFRLFVSGVTCAPPVFLSTCGTPLTSLTRSSKAIGLASSSIRLPAPLLSQRLQTFGLARCALHFSLGTTRAIRFYVTRCMSLLTLYSSHFTCRTVRTQHLTRCTVPHAVHLLLHFSLQFSFALDSSYPSHWDHVHVTLFSSHIALFTLFTVLFYISACTASCHMQYTQHPHVSGQHRHRSHLDPKAHWSARLMWSGCVQNWNMSRCGTGVLRSETMKEMPSNEAPVGRMVSDFPRKKKTTDIFIRRNRFMVMCLAFTHAELLGDGFLKIL